ncbi:MAG: phage integrase [Proteobacteria bacterium]|nr:phage integrase [Pseudomonadota bacterium]
MSRLTDIHIRNWIKAGKPVAKSFGNGLTFTLSASGYAAWVLRYRLHGKQRELTIGRYPEFSIKKATEEAFKRRVEVVGGIDVAGEKRRQKKADRTAKTVKELGDFYYEDLAARGRSVEGSRWHLDAYIEPKLGGLQLHEVTPDEVLAMCDSIKAKPRRPDKESAPSSAREVLGTLRRMFDFAIERRLAKLNPASAIKPRTVAEKKSRERALTREELSTLWAALQTDQISPTAGMAIRMLYLTLARKTEVTRSAWSEISFDRAEWDIPAERTKTRKPHRVYLSTQALTILEEAKRLGCESPFVFPGKNEKPIGDTTLNEALKRAKYFGLNPFTIHDSRRTASTFLHEMDWPSDVIEKALNHTAQGIRAVYNRAEYADRRRCMLQAWADFLDSLIENRKQQREFPT